MSGFFCGSQGVFFFHVKRLQNPFYSSKVKTILPINLYICIGVDFGCLHTVGHVACQCTPQYLSNVWGHSFYLIF